MKANKNKIELFPLFFIIPSIPCQDFIVPRLIASEAFCAGKYAIPIAAAPVWEVEERSGQVCNIQFFKNGGWKTTSFGGSSPPDGAVGKRENDMTRTSSKVNKPSRGRADLARVRRESDAEIARTAPTELADLPDNFWDEADACLPNGKKGNFPSGG
jgi:hypothetical protein